MGFNGQKCLTEKTDGKGIVFTFGRFTPPHSGHEVLINRVVSVARKLGYEHGIYASKSYGDKRNPLKYKDKIKYLKGAFRNANIVNDASLFNPFVVAKHLSNEGYKHVVLVVGGDRASDLERSIRKYIGHKDPTKSFDFDSFKVVSAGKRDPDADDITGMSASKMRRAATEGDFDTFKVGVPSGMKERDAKKMYDDTRKGLGIKESLTNFFDGLDPYITGESLKEEAYRLLDNKNLSLLGLMEEESESEKPTIIVLTKYDEDGNYSDTTQKIEKACEHLGLSFYAVSVDSAYVVDDDMDDDKITIHNYNGDDMKINLDVNNTVCIPRGSILGTYAGVGILSILQDTGMFTVNKVSQMELCQNKFATAITLERGKVNSPRTALVANEDAIDVALKKIGGEFPVVLKTITGAEGIGVSLIESEKSLKGVLQSLWKFDAEVIIQEYFEIEFDVRTIVVDGQIIASIKRNKGDSDFRTNKSLGNKTEPYTLNEEEKKLVLKAAKTVGCYLCGVDHIVVDGGKEYKVLEVNGSPGSGADTYMGYLSDDDSPKEINGQEMIDHIVEYISDRDNWKMSTTEIGVLEKVKIDGIDDEIDARIDTGNESHNVLHATHIDHDKEFDTVEFKSMGKNFDLPYEGFVTIDMGQDNIEKRPVVKIDMKLGNKLYKNVKFSLSDRDRQDYEVLIGKRFLKMANLSVNVAKTYELQEESKELNSRFVGDFLAI